MFDVLYIRLTVLLENAGKQKKKFVDKKYSENFVLISFYLLFPFLDPNTQFFVELTKWKENTVPMILDYLKAVKSIGKTEVEDPNMEGKKFAQKNLGRSFFFYEKV